MRFNRLFYKGTNKYNDQVWNDINGQLKAQIIGIFKTIGGFFSVTMLSADNPLTLVW